MPDAMAGFSRPLVATLGLLALLSAGPSHAEEPEDKPVLADLGCWGRESQKPNSRWPTNVSFCFFEAGRVSGNTFDDGDGWDWGFNWRRIGQDQVEFKDEDWVQVCTMVTSPESQVLRIENCEGVEGEGLQGDWLRRPDPDWATRPGAP